MASSTLIVTVLVILISSNYILSCGVTQHNLIAHKAMGWYTPTGEYDVFLNIIQQNQDAFQNGAAFPDWGYACAGESDASETTHWPPFTIAYIDYFNGLCGSNPGNWTTHCNKMVAFLFGIVSHQVADVLWHDLTAAHPTRQGFIQAMADFDFGGDFGNAHSAADAGAEFVVAREFDLSFIQLNWYLPSSDLANIYSQYFGYSIPESTISECNLELYAEVHAVTVGGAILFPHASKSSLFLVDQLLNYWIGGIDDNAIWTSTCWSDYLMQWIAPFNSTRYDHPICTVQSPITANFFKSMKHTRSPQVSELIDQAIEEKLVSYSTDENGVTTYSQSPNFKSELLQNPILKPDENPQNIGSACPVTNSTSSDTQILGSMGYSYVGWSMSSGDIDMDGLTDLVIGAPGWGTAGTPEQGGIYIHYGSSGPYEGTINLPSTPTLTGTEEHDRFGWASTIVDINKDGYNDLIVSSPTTQYYNLNYKGQLNVFLGSSSGLPVTPSFYFTTSNNYTNLGYTLVNYDCNHDGFLDVLVSSPFAGSGASSPQNGKVYLILSSSSFRAGNSYDIDATSTWVLEGGHEAEWYGQHVDFTTLPNGNELIIISAPGYNSDTTSASSSELGKIHAYLLPSLMQNGTKNEIFSIEGSNLWDQSGYSFSVGPFPNHPSTLALGAPSTKTGLDQEQYGAVYLIDISSLTGSVTLGSARHFALLQGDSKFSRFGWVTVFEDSTGKGDYSLWITQPRKDYDTFTPEAGSIFRWATNESPSHTNDPITSSTACLASNQKNNRFGETLHFADLDGNGVTDVIVGAPRHGNNLEGSVYIQYR